MKEATRTKGRWLLLAGLVLAAVLLLENRRVLPPLGQAQALDNPAQSRLDMREQLQKVNEKLDRLIALLQSGKVKVVVANAEEIRGVAPGGAPPAALPGAGEQQDVPKPTIIIKRKGE